MKASCHFERTRKDCEGGVRRNLLRHAFELRVVVLQVVEDFSFAPTFFPALLYRNDIFYSIEIALTPNSF